MNIITNGTFDTDLDNWSSAPAGAWIWDTGRALNQSITHGITQGGLDIVLGATYTVSFDYEKTDTGIYDFTIAFGLQTVHITGTGLPSGTFTQDFTATQDDVDIGQLTIKDFSDTTGLYIDNVSAEVFGLLPVYATSLISSVQKVQQNTSLPQFVIGGRNAGSYALFKKTSAYGTVISLWRSPVYQIGKNFDVLKIKFPVTGGITGNKDITPVLYFDNASSSSVGTEISTGNYVNLEKLITLNSKNFNNKVRGTNNFYLELQIPGTALSVVKLPITIEIDVLDV